MFQNRSPWALGASCLLVSFLAACSSGGGGGGAGPSTTTPPSNTNTTPPSNTNTTPPSNTNTTPPTPTVSIGAPDNANVTIQAASFKFGTNPPPVGTVFGLLGPAVKVTSTTVYAANKGTNGTLTYRGVSNGIPVFDLSIPALNINAPGLPGDGTTTPVSGGGTAAVSIGNLQYSVQGIWTYSPGGGVTYRGVTAVGSGTPIASVPIGGTATYSAAYSNSGGGTAGIFYVPDGNGGISTGSVSGNIAVTVNFGTGAVTGSLSNMVAKHADGSAATPWNDVSLSANINRLPNNASFTGTTSTSGPPAGAGNTGFSSSATGQLGGAFFGPNADEVGGTWTLTDPNAAGGGKTAFGAFGATSNGCSGCSLGSGGSGAGGNTAPTGPVSITVGSISLTTFSGGNLGTSFTSNPPSFGASVPLGGAAVAITPTSVSSFSLTPGGVTGIYRGTATSNGVSFPVFDLSIPALSLTATNVHGDGTIVAFGDGGKISAAGTTMNYTLLGAWAYTPGSGNTSYLGQVVTGYGTAPASIPTTGSATYNGAGGVVGSYAIPSGTNAIQMGTVSGDVSLNVNFASDTATGSFTNMNTRALGASTTTPWNDVALTGTLTRGTSNVTINGQTSTTTNSNPAGFSNAAHGNFNGAFYGPAGQEVGGMWMLSESTAGGGKAAFGTFGAK